MRALKIQVKTRSAAVGLTVALAACNTPRAHLHVLTVGLGAAAVLGGLTLYKTGGCNGDNDYREACYSGRLTDEQKLGVGLLIGGAVSALLALLTFPEEPSNEKASTIPSSAPDAVRAAGQERAWTLTKSAAAAARVGDCDTVKRLANEVRQADASFHETVFLRDVAIAGCPQQPQSGGAAQ